MISCVGTFARLSNITKYILLLAFWITSKTWQFHRSVLVMVTPSNLTLSTLGVSTIATYVAVKTWVALWKRFRYYFWIGFEFYLNCNFGLDMISNCPLSAQIFKRSVLSDTGMSHTLASQLFYCSILCFLLFWGALQLVKLPSTIFTNTRQDYIPDWVIIRALHRYRRGQGFESRTSLNFFQAFFSQLQKLHLY